MDVILVAQYFHYRSDKPSIPLYAHTRTRTSSSIGRRLSPETYRTLSTVAANVAAGAALAAQQEEADWPYPHSRRLRRSTDRVGEGSSSRISRELTEQGVGGEIEDAAQSALANSFCSEGGQTSRRKRVSWSGERYKRSGSVGGAPTSPIPASLRITSRRPDDIDPLNRGRSSRREDGSDEETDGWGDSGSARIRRTSSKASRRGAGIVFLGVWALFGIGTLARNRNGSPSDGISHVGRVLTSKTTAAIAIPTAFTYTTSSLEAIPLSVIPNDSDPPPLTPSEDRVLGRIFAWLCTTLYLTSRLPQIWKNVSIPYSLADYPSI